MIRKNLAAELAELNKDYDGKPDPFSDQLAAGPENPKGAEAREELKRWRSFSKQPWAPDALTEAAIAELEDQPNIWLDAAVNLMAFGQINPNTVDTIESGARRIQAIRALCNLGIFSLTRNGVPVDQQEEIPQSLWPHTKIWPAGKFIEWLRKRCGAPKLSRAAKEAKFKAWRESQGGTIPTFEQDKAHMKQFGVGRDEVKNLREGYRTRPRGRPKAT